MDKYENSAKKQDFSVACWIRTMFDLAYSSCPERHSGLIAHELSSLDIDIAALSEVHLAYKGSLQELGAGFTFFWFGKSSTDIRFLVVGFVVRNSIASIIILIPI